MRRQILRATSLKIREELAKTNQTDLVKLRFTKEKFNFHTRIFEDLGCTFNLHQ